MEVLSWVITWVLIVALVMMGLMLGAGKAATHGVRRGLWQGVRAGLNSVAFITGLVMLVFALVADVWTPIDYLFGDIPHLALAILPFLVIGVVLGTLLRCVLVYVWWRKKTANPRENMGSTNLGDLTH